MFNEIKGIVLRITPEPTMRRLPHYLHFLHRQAENGVTRISSTVISTELSLDATQVRKDLEYTGVKGRPKTGFVVEELIKAINEFLDWHLEKAAFLVGAGNLGSAMLGYKRFNDYGLNIIAAFDSDETKIGTHIYNTPIFSIDKIPAMAQKMNVKIGVITVPAFAAQQAADLLIEGGIKAIWNFAPMNIRVPQNIVVENAQFSESLAALSRKLVEINYKEK
ncbi:MAG: redox-sensing transcriptional repressor Rex [Melioribacteraceae bacterium]|nr:MAG: redox-sensing transcriptional repressor Rex [Melioribacteraceae bacterium]